MKPATWPRPDLLANRLLHLDPPAGRFSHRRMGELPALLRAGDLLVVNDAATLPASLGATTRRGEPFELRLTGPAEDGVWTAVALGPGDWRVRTEDRPAPPRLAPGDLIQVGPDLRARVARVRPESPRLVELRFDREGAALWTALYRRGRPVQYSYLSGPLDLWHVQTAYAGRPWAAELPSAGHPLTWSLLQALRRAGVRLAAVTHAAGLSSTGDAALDERLPLAERSEVGPETAAAVRCAHALRRRVIAVGTTVVRALESASGADGTVHAGSDRTALVIEGSFRPRVVDGVLSGLHEPGSSHFRLLSAFGPAALLEEALRAAEEADYLAHEFGDSLLVLATASAETSATSPTVSSA